MQLFEGTRAERSVAVKRLDKLVAEKSDFSSVVGVAGQTYSRKTDTLVVAALSGLGETAHKICTDLRLLAHDKEVEEPFDSSQVQHIWNYLNNRAYVRCCLLLSDRLIRHAV